MGRRQAAGTEVRDDGDCRFAKEDRGGASSQAGLPDPVNPGSVSVTCREFAEFMVDYFSGELSADARAVFEHHLSLCENCDRYLTSYRESVALGKRAFDDETAMVPPEVPDVLVKATQLGIPR